MLRHVKTRKYVAISKSEGADVETECLKAMVTDQINGFARFRICSRYRMREAGDSVSTGDQFFLRLSKRPLQALHACPTPSDKVQSATSDRVLEVNSSLAATSWRVIPFSSFEPDLDEFIQCGTIVEVFHAETDASLLCEDEHGTSVDITPSRQDLPEPAEGAPPGFHSLRCGAKADEKHLEKASAQRTYLFKNPEDAGTRNTNSLWVLEKSTGFFGGPSGGVARWNSRFRFRRGARKISAAWSSGTSTSSSPFSSRSKRAQRASSRMCGWARHST